MVASCVMASMVTACAGILKVRGFSLTFTSSFASLLMLHRSNTIASVGAVYFTVTSAFSGTLAVRVPSSALVNSTALPSASFTVTSAFLTVRSYRLTTGATGSVSSFLSLSLLVSSGLLSPGFGGRVPPLLVSWLSSNLPPEITPVFSLVTAPVKLPLPMVPLFFTLPENVPSLIAPLLVTSPENVPFSILPSLSFVTPPEN